MEIKTTVRRPVFSLTGRFRGVGDRNQKQLRLSNDRAGRFRSFRVSSGQNPNPLNFSGFASVHNFFRKTSKKPKKKLKIFGPVRLFNDDAGRNHAPDRKGEKTL
ncbi:MAG: hypothetical protein JSS81_00010 [Acidobacteria bacterium]|nr:hypothetical protein [Acidobacteriota bacterium]